MPRAADVIIGPAWCAPPPALAASFGRGDAWLVGLDLETNDWEDSRGNKGTFGQFEHYNLCKPQDLEARIVQLGYAFGPAGSKATVKEYLVRPRDFRISEKAERYHGISNAQAEANGRELAEVLEEFLRDLKHLVKEESARVVCHHLEF